jgi:hypothetical protein
MTGRWVPDPLPEDGPDGRGEAGPPGALETRRETEEVATTGRAPDGSEVRDRSNPLEPEADAEASGRPAE